MRIKICGITSARDAVDAADAGADAVGLNFVAGPRRIDPARAEPILAALPPFVVPVALVDVTGGGVPDSLRGLLDAHRISHVQMYGDVSPETVARLRREGLFPLLVQRVRGDEFPASTQAFLDPCGSAPPSAIVLDAHDNTRQGGTGRTLDWDRIAQARQSRALDGWPPIILAGGLNPDNVAQAVSTVRPWGVDVSSGVEKTAGHKSADLMRAFVQAARELP